VSRRLAVLVALAVVVVVVAGLAAALAYELATPGAVPAPDRPGDGIAATAQTGTRAAFFGDRVTAGALVVVDTGKVDPRSVHATADFRPFEVVGATRQESRSGRVLTQQIRWTLLCLDPACLPGSAGHDFSWAPVDVRYRLRGTALQRELTVPFEPARMLTRLAKHAAAHPRFRVPPPVVEPASYRIDPHSLWRWLLLGGAFLCAVGIALAAVVLARTRSRRSAPPDAFALVLRELRLAASGNGDSGRRRRALERLAELVEPLDRPLSSETRRLAWAPDDPPPDAIDELARRAREAASG
jgi:hypothetical protein